MLVDERTGQEEEFHAKGGLREFVAYIDLADMKAVGSFADTKSIIMSVYMLCGFANFASIGIQIGGIGALAPGKRVQLSRLGMRALLAGTLAALLSADDHVPNSVSTTARVHIGTVDGAPTIHTIELICEADVPGIDAGTFLEYAQNAKEGCPVSKALAAVNVITLEANLIDS